MLIVFILYKLIGEKSEDSYFCYYYFAVVSNLIIKHYSLSANSIFS